MADSVVPLSPHPSEHSSGRAMAGGSRDSPDSESLANDSLVAAALDGSPPCHLDKREHSYSTLVIAEVFRSYIHN